MRELEFLPDWYPQVRRRRQVVTAQAWTLVVLLVALGAWSMSASRGVRRAEGRVAQLTTALSASRTELAQLDELLTLERQLGQQEQILARVGTHVETARLLATLDEVMPPEMALVDLTFRTEERQVGGAGGVPLKGPGSKLAKPVMDRRLRVRLVGVAPTDAGLAEFLKRLTDRPFFEGVAMTYARDRTDRGHLMREFEVLFSMNLNEPG